jgi:glycolate oxidase
MLLIEIDGENKELVESEYETIGELCIANGAIEVYVADNYTTIERIWKIRRNVAEAFKVVSPHQSLEDIVVPISNIPDFVRGLAGIIDKYDVPIPCYGHAGDGNLHATVVKNPDFTMEKWHEILPKVLTEMYELTAQLGGTISGEHGIGSKRKHYMKLVMNEDQLNVMRRIKKALDPNNILNPGKIFDME